MTNTHNPNIHTQTITFTTMRIHRDHGNNYHVDNLEDHLNRLYDTMTFLKKHMQTNHVISKHHMENTIHEYLTDLESQDIYENNSFCLVTYIKAGAENPALEFSHRPLRYTQTMYDTGFKLQISTMGIHSTSPAIRHKTNNYLDNKLQLSQLANGIHEALRFNEKNYLCEGCYSNIFIIDKNNHIKTPSLENGLLSGIMRKKVIDYSKLMSYNISETNITMDDLTQAKSVFITNSLMGVMWINEIKDLKNTYKRSPILDELIKAHKP